ncbi:hypothetical protein QO002_000640 [Pararhizobium capsulatum DSM 1112]|uniref:Uncharacterized protein n=1 Tax=Pararhizobium capsulatum DSM 1112 TaxID=1121113 RepID=A0ABU0BNP0_9HYPH|nr:hypothetical protein [Pararhizobium capsulatum]MDQ0318502.1 hypothetical protein [Pararhizobium capsulatum DSM 1112]
MKKTYIFFSVVCLALAAGSLHVLSGELEPFVAERFPDAKISGAFSADALAHGMSSYSKEMIMKDCFVGIRGYNKADIYNIKAMSAVEKCRIRASGIVKTTPTDSFAWLVRAAASIRLGKVEEFNQSVTNSQMSGPNEQWIARHRVELVENFLPQADAPTLASHTIDLGSLASSGRGVRYLAGRYISNPDFRERITAIVETLPPKEQRAFLANIKRVMREGEI